MLIPSESLKVVMVDDDKDDLFLTERTFGRSKYNIDFVGLNSASDLFAYIEENGIRSIDTLLLDLNMPRMGGRQILGELKRYPGHEKLNTFIFSTSTHAKDKKECIEKGAKGYFAKPANAEQSHQFITMLMQHIGLDEAVAPSQSYKNAQG